MTAPVSPHRPKQKDVRRPKNRPIPNPPPPSIHPSQESLVVPTSDFHPAPAVSSQLPPSDPPSSTLPLPTSTPESAKKRRQGADVDDADESPLDPLKKRKRQRVVMDDDEDDEAYIPPPQPIATADQPPPTYFASSSSSLPPPPAPLIRGESRKKLVKGKQVTDDAPLPKASIPILRKGRADPSPKRSPVSVSSWEMLDNHRLFPRLRPGPGPMPRNRRMRVWRSSKTLMKREDHSFCPIRLADLILNHRSRIFLNRQVLVHRNPLPLYQRGLGTGQCRQGWGERKSEREQEAKEGRRVF
jgi:hypothetical protein